MREVVLHEVLLYMSECCCFRHSSLPNRTGESLDQRVVQSTRKGTLLENVPRGVVTWTSPVVAPVGTVVEILNAEPMVKATATPLNVTLVAPVKSLPRIVTASPTTPVVGSVFTNGPRPADTLKTAPSPLAPSKYAVPYNLPFVSWAKAPVG